jgi:spore coat polysaccharide biosynthesis protein SpsF (cytidylyltransferase family)
VRLTADCPLIDPGVIDTTVAAFLAEPCDYASNSLALTYPRGLDVEVFTRGALNCAWSEAQQPYQRSHVTPFLYEHPDRFKVLSVTREKDYGSLRWTLDTPEDLRLIETIYQRFGGSDNFKEEDVLGLFAREPTLALINAHIRQKALLEG